MGQQQLLLLVLSTVIVGLATVAGIQAFDENRNQAAADALNQRAATLAADVKGIYEKPEQFGGLASDLSNVSTTEVTNKLGIPASGAVVPGASDGGTDATCSVSAANSSNGIVIDCSGEGQFSNIEAYGVFNPGGNPEVSVQSTDPT